ncbi:MAG: M48 family metallopeptidase [Pseudomonadota bacterium]|nr:M48 family metallopeptidase [Pseudomonadota bacterium]
MPASARSEPARFLDGISARPHPVEISVTASGLHFGPVDGVSRHWRAQGLRLVDILESGRLFRFAHADHGAERLLVPAGPALTTIRENLPDVFARRRGSAVDLRIAVRIIAVCIVVLGGLWLSLPALVRLATALVPLSVEREMGEQTLRSLSGLVDGLDRTCVAPAGEAALAALVTRLEDGRPLRVPVQVHVVDSGIENAVALPGGVILVFRGLLENAGGGNELAGVLAHEIGHAQYRHGMQQYIRANALSLLFSLIATGGLSDMGSMLGQTLVTLSYGRDAEREADDYAVETLNRTGISGDGLAGFFARHSDGSGSSGMLSVLSTHPPSAERQAAIDAATTGTGAAMSDTDWQDLKTICRITEPTLPRRRG